MSVFDVPSDPANTPLGDPGDTSPARTHTQLLAALGAAIIAIENAKGAVSGYASLDSGGHVPDAQIPSTIARDTEITTAVNNAVTALVAGAPGTLDVLDELAAALGDDPNFATTMATNLATKLAKASNLSDLTNVATARTNLGVDAAGTTVMPWIVDVDVFMTAIAQTNWNTNAGLAQPYGASKNSTGAQNAEISFDVVLGPGTWTYEQMHTVDSDRGIYTITLDTAALSTFGGSADTIDSYAAGPGLNTRASITGIVIPTPVKRRLRLKMATKNASATNYYGTLQHIQFRRTA